MCADSLRRLVKKGWNTGKPHCIRTVETVTPAQKAILVLPTTNLLNYDRLNLGVRHEPAQNADHPLTSRLSSFLILAKDSTLPSPFHERLHRPDTYLDYLSL